MADASIRNDWTTGNIARACWKLYKGHLEIFYSYGPQRLIVTASIMNCYCTEKSDDIRIRLSGLDPVERTHLRGRV